MLSLISCIKQIPSNRVAFSSFNKKTTYLDILNIYETNTKTLEQLKASAVLLKGFSRYDFSILLSLLDGNVSKILFLPSDINDTLANQYIKTLNITYTLEFKNNTLKYKQINKKKDFSNIGNTQWIIPTSGTTSTPKLIVHTLKSLTVSTKINIKKGNNFRWGFGFDIYRFSGIQVFLQSILSGSTLIISNESDKIETTMKLFHKNRCNTMSATPSFYIKALMTKEFVKLNLTNITLGGEIVNQKILDSLSIYFKNANIRHIYASTEAGVGFSVSDKKEGFPKEYLNNKTNNIKFKIDKNNILLIKSKYNCEYIDTGDLVKIDNDRVYFLGRSSGAINVGGNKVIPEEVEQVLMSYSLVQHAYVFSKKNSIMGSLVYANVVLKPSSLNITMIKKDIIEHCKKYLENFKIPAIIKIVDEIETTRSGKVQRG